jgi:hypothetical protein
MASQGNDPEPPPPKLVREWAQRLVLTLPSRQTPGPLTKIDSKQWPDFVRRYPNPTIFTADNVARGTDCLKEFHCANTIVVFLDYTTFWHHVYPQVHCPKCKSCAHTATKGWNETLRRAASKEGTIYMYGRKYTCKGCNSSFSAFDSEVIAALPEYIRSQLPIVVTSQSGAIGRCDMDQLEREACTGTAFAQMAEAYKEYNMRR